MIGNVILEDSDFKLLNNFSSSAIGKYSQYLKEHIENVQRFYNIIKNTLKDTFYDSLEIPLEEMEAQIRAHDASKWGTEEFLPYAEHFYGDDDKEAFDLAVAHHYSNNPHHPEYWRPAVVMPYSCIIEMLSDWGSFGLKENNINQIFEFWENNKDEKFKFMNPETARIVNEILTVLKNNFNNADENEYLTEAVLIKPSSVVETSIFKNIEKLIRNSEQILIVRHIAPDADALYSARSLSDAIRNKYPEKNVILGDEKTQMTLTNKDVLIILDLGVSNRIAAHFNGNPKTIRIDHHKTGMNADVVLEMPEAGSTCELVTLFLLDQGYDITKNMADGLFKGIISDTGRMQYSLSQTTLAALSILTSQGIKYKDLYNQMYVKNDKELKSKAYILQNYKKLPNGVAYLFIDKSRADAANINTEDIMRQVYEMSEIKNSPIWAVLRENGHGEITMKIRSRIIPVNQIAEIFGGGGHENAAGLKVKNRDIAKQVLIKLDDYLRKMKIKMPELR